jgi:hypothetical protein
MSVLLQQVLFTQWKPFHHSVTHRHQLIEILVGWLAEAQSPEADIMQSLIVDAVSSITVLHQLMH